jgi:hypothetical protein
MSETWRTISKRIIQRTIQDVGIEDIPALKCALRAAYPFGERKHFPYKMWCEEQRRAMILIMRKSKSIKFPKGSLFSSKNP